MLIDLEHLIIMHLCAFMAMWGGLTLLLADTTDASDSADLTDAANTGPTGGIVK